ncbi:MAG: hypothetical protein O2884_09555 [Chloroflexi bacterium]|nr:hypothetical protein [Chloroflexota bacterium]
MPALAVLAHHSEPSDPRLLRWVIDTLEPMLGLGPAVVIIPVAIFVVAFPIVLAGLALRSRRRQREADETDGDLDGRLAR